MIAALISLGSSLAGFAAVGLWLRAALLGRRCRRERDQLRFALDQHRRLTAWRVATLRAALAEAHHDHFRAWTQERGIDYPIGEDPWA